MRLLSVLVLPALILAGAFGLEAGLYRLPGELAALLPMGPYGLGILAGLLGLWFHGARAVFVLGIFAAAYWALVTFLPGFEATGIYALVLYPALSLLVPANVALFAYLDERGLFSAYGLTRVSFLALQALGLLVLSGHGFGFPGLPEGATQGLATFLNTPWLEVPLTEATPIPENGVIVFALALLLISFRVLALATPLDGGFLVALLAVAVGFHRAGLGGDGALWFSSAALIILASVVHGGYRFAFIDELTGLPGRRALMTRMKKTGSTVTVAMADVDHFKKFNDTYGHDVGDQVLRMVAGRLKKITGGGKAYRYGGEEFTIVFPGRDATAAQPHLEKLVKAIADKPFIARSPERPKERPKAGEKKAAREKGGTEKAQITISIGFADRGSLALTEGVDAMDPDALIKAADQALYRAKDGGRNRVSG